MIQTFAVLLYLLPFVTLALILGFVWFAARMAKEPPSDEPQAEEEVLAGDDAQGGFATPIPEEPAAEGSVIRVTRTHDRYSQS